jgi:hypothetical protein
MSTFFLDIWSDLREKRLWPVAVALLVGVLAVPVLLSKPAADVPAAAPSSVAAPEGPAVAGQVLPADLEAAKPLLETSTLNEFDSKDPFKPLKALEKVEQAAGVEPTPTDGLAGGATGGAEPGDLGGGETGGGGGGGGGETPSVQEEERTVFTYQAVVELTTASGIKKRTVDRLGILPRASNPLLVFLGVSADDNGEAVFLVDSTVTQGGEGRCRPSAATCSFLYLTTANGNDEHIFTTDGGKEFGIKLLQIRRVEVKAQQGSSPSLPNAQAGRASAEFTSVDPNEDPFAGFDFPLFADEEE